MNLIINSWISQQARCHENLSEGVRFLGRGACKAVYSHPQRPGSVLLTPIFRFNESSLRSELKTVEAIRADILAQQLCTTHLALDMQEDTTGQLRGRYTLCMPRADGDVESAVLSKTGLVFEQVMNCGVQFVQGMASLHQAGWVHGDIKPDNALVYGAPEGALVKISDFGKAIPLKEEEIARYQANSRFCPPERLLSQKGEVYSCGLVLIDMLERLVIDTDTTKPFLMDVPKSASTERHKRGITGYFAAHPDIAKPLKNTLKEVLLRLLDWVANKTSVLFFLSSGAERKAKEFEHVRGYIIMLCARLLEKNLCSVATANALKDLLISMTNAEPSKRLPMQEAVERITAILKAHNEETKPIPQPATQVGSCVETLQPNQLSQTAPQEGWKNWAYRVLITDPLSYMYFYPRQAQ